jgi:DNA-binding transcriptional MerR regulator
MQTQDELLGPYDASKIADVSPQTVRSWGDQGKLSVIRTAGGMRLFKRSEVEALAAERKETEKIRG